MKEPNDRLSRLAAYRDLPGRARRALAAHIRNGLDGPTAMGLAGSANPKRDWNSPRLQAVLAEYQSTVQIEESAELAEIAQLIDRPDPKPVEIALGANQGTPAPPAEPQPLISHSSANCKNSALQTKDLNINQLVTSSEQTDPGRCCPKTAEDPIEHLRRLESELHSPTVRMERPSYEQIFGGAPPGFGRINGRPAYFPTIEENARTWLEFDQQQREERAELVRRYEQAERARREAEADQISGRNLGWGRTLR